MKDLICRLGFWFGGQKNNPRDLSAEEILRLREIDSILGCGFHDLNSFRQALTHKSFVNEQPDLQLKDNERLEFLGDAVLDLVVSEHLMKEFPEETEGVLSKVRSAMVNERALASLAETFGLGNFLFLGRGERQSGGSQKPSLLANAYEAVLGALFLDRGFHHSRTIILQHFESVFAEARKGKLLKDYKTQVQEMVQSQYQGSLLRYVLVQQSGPDHEKTFEVALRIDDRTYGVGSGRNKKEAEQNAAREALEKLSN